MASKTTGKLNLWLTKMTDKISDTISTYLYENFTKIDTEFSAHLAESASKHIAESGSNDNGYYIKFDDGTMICSLTNTFSNLDITTASGALYESESKIWSFPATFIATPVVSGNITSLTTSAKNSMICGQLINTTTFTFKILTSIAFTAMVRYALIAVGRWK